MAMLIYSRTIGYTCPQRTNERSMNEPAFIDMMVQIGIKNMDDTFVKSDGQPPEKPKDDFVPASPNSPEMYASGDDENSAKARVYFRNKGHVYGRTD